MSTSLIEIDSPCTLRPLPMAVAALVEDGLRRSKKIDCFDFVPSSAAVLYSRLAEFPVGKYCEWGSGIGVGVGIARLLGFDALGVEIHEELAVESRQLLADHGIKATIKTGDYFEDPQTADYYFAYCWPGQMNQVEQLFSESAPDHAILLICHGAEDLRCKVKSSASRAIMPESGG
jgi:hypothetical protein